MDKVAVATLLTSPADAPLDVAAGWTALAAVTVPTHAEYARRVGADQVTLGRRVYGHPQYDKWQLADLFDRYDRVLFVDLDAVVRPDTPDLFAMVPPERFAGENELLTYPPQAGHVEAFARRLGVACPPVRYYVNTGVFLASRVHRGLFRPPELVPADLPWPEQTHLNLRLLSERVPVHLLPQAFNERHRKGDYRRGSFVLHYSMTGNAERVAAARADLAAWDVLLRRA